MAFSGITYTAETVYHVSFERIEHLPCKSWEPCYSDWMGKLQSQLKLSPELCSDCPSMDRADGSNENPGHRLAIQTTPRGT